MTNSASVRCSRQAQMFFLWIRVKIGRPLYGVDFARLSSWHESVNAAPWPTDKLAGLGIIDRTNGKK